MKINRQTAKLIFGTGETTLDTGQTIEEGVFIDGIVYRQYNGATISMDKDDKALQCDMRLKLTVPTSADNKPVSIDTLMQVLYKGRYYEVTDKRDIYGEFWQIDLKEIR